MRSSLAFFLAGTFWRTPYRPQRARVLAFSVAGGGARVLCCRRTEARVSFQSRGDNMRPAVEFVTVLILTAGLSACRGDAGKDPIAERAGRNEALIELDR